MRLTRTCPRCGAQIEPSHSPDSKECSDNCITRHQARVASLEAALRDIEDIATHYEQPYFTITEIVRVAGDALAAGGTE